MEQNENKVSCQSYFWAIVRSERDKRLHEVDLLINNAEDNGIDATPLRKHRQDLRDIPQDNDDPISIKWPTLPVVQ